MPSELTGPFTSPDCKRCKLRATVAKLPKCWRLNEAGERVQDVAMHPGMRIWLEDGAYLINPRTRKTDGLVMGVAVGRVTIVAASEVTVQLLSHELYVFYPNQCCNTREAAEAKEKPDNPERWCDWQYRACDEVSWTCMAHLQEGRALACHCESMADAKERQDPCLDAKPVEAAEAKEKPDAD